MSITDQVKEWPETCQLEGVFDFSNEGELRYQSNRNAALEARLRTTAEALRGEVDDIDWIFACFPALSEVLTADQIARLCQRLTDARAVLAQLEKEGLT